MAARWCGDWAPGLGWREHLPGSMWPTCSLHLHFFFNLHPRTCFLLIFGEGAWERNIDKRVRHRSVASPTHPNRGSNPQPGCVTGLGNQAHDLLVYETMLQPREPHWPGPLLHLSKPQQGRGQAGLLVAQLPHGKDEVGSGGRGARANMHCTARASPCRKEKTQMMPRSQHSPHGGVPSSLSSGGAPDFSVNPDQPCCVRALLAIGGATCLPRPSRRSCRLLCHRLPPASHVGGGVCKAGSVMRGNVSESVMLMGRLSPSKVSPARPPRGS